MKTLFPVLLAVLLLTAGCAAHRRDTYLQDKAAGHVYPVPLSQLWPEARGLLASKGYSLREAPGAHELVTEWLQVGTASSLGTTYQRYLIRGRKHGSGQSSVQFFKMVRIETEVTMRGSHELVDDHELAWELLQRFDATAAKQYQDEAAQKYP